MPASPSLVWLRQDLRIADNPALAAASQAGPVIPVLVLDDAAAGPWRMGGANRWWLHGSVTALSRALERIGSRLVLRRGNAIEHLLDIARSTGARHIHASRAYEPHARRQEQDLVSRCAPAGLTLQTYPGALLHDPDKVRTKAGEPFRVFTPFWRTLQAAGPPLPPLPAPAALIPPEQWPRSDALADWQLLPTRPDWAGGLRATWTPGEAGAQRRLAAFLSEALGDYASDRDRPDRPGTSMLSAHLHFGEISPRQCWHAVEAVSGHARQSGGAASFLRELAWREFSTHLLYHWPPLPEAPFRAEFAGFPWDGDAARVEQHLAAWSRGLTGYPIVDAGMRQLWQTGWMHNRVRMIVASFLIKHLLVPWQRGADWFWDTLVDADLANNAASWQWVAGSGADAAPYFRIFNPVLQGAKFDPDGAYVRRFVPELGRLEARHIHAPWQAAPLELAAAGVKLGHTYPEPMVDHGEARARALAAFAALKSHDA